MVCFEVIYSSNPILVLDISNNVNYNCGCLYRAEPAYIAHFTCLYRFYIFILEINVIE